MNVSEFSSPIAAADGASSDEEVQSVNTIGALFHYAMENTPQLRTSLLMPTAASSAGKIRWSYQELGRRVDAVRQWLRRRHQPADRIAIWAPNVAEWVLVYLAAVSEGLVVVSLNPALTEEELAAFMDRTQTRTLFTVEEYRGTPMLEVADHVAERGDGRLRVVDLATIGRLTPVSEVTAAVSPTTVFNPDAAAMIQFTSGTTGTPKGAVLTHLGLVTVARAFVRRLAVPDGAAWYTASPLFHVGGCGMYVLGCLAIGGTMVCDALFTPKDFLASIERERCVIAGGVPTMLTAVLEEPEFASYDLSSLATICSGAAAQPPALIKKIEDRLGVDYCALYGLTESSGAISGVEPTAPLKTKASSVGRPLDHVEVKIVDPIKRTTVPVGAVGELLGRGPTMMAEYLDMEEETASTIDGNGWMRTGDLCSMDEDGFIQVRGRLKDMIIRGGENIYPKEIEDCLHEHESVIEAVVTGIPDELWGELPAAFIRTDVEGEDELAKKLFRHCRTHISPYKTPAYWVFLEEIPYNSAGKARKSELADRFVAGEFTSFAGRD